MKDINKKFKEKTDKLMEVLRQYDLINLECTFGEIIQILRNCDTSKETEYTYQFTTKEVEELENKIKEFKTQYDEARNDLNHKRKIIFNVEMMLKNGLEDL